MEHCAGTDDNRVFSLGNVAVNPAFCGVSSADFFNAVFSFCNGLGKYFIVLYRNRKTGDRVIGIYAFSGERAFSQSSIPSASFSGWWMQMLIWLEI